MFSSFSRKGLSHAETQRRGERQDKEEGRGETKRSGKDATPMIFHSETLVSDSALLRAFATLRESILLRVVRFDCKHERSCCDILSGGDTDFFHDARVRRADFVFHFHGFENGERLAL